MVGIVAKAEAKFPPLGEVEVIVIPRRHKGSRQVVCIKGTHETLIVAPEQLKLQEGESRLIGRLIDRQSQPGTFLPTYVGEVVLAATNRSMFIPAAALR